MNQVLRALLLTLLVGLVVAGAVHLLSQGKTGLRRHALEFFEHYWKGEVLDPALAKKYESAGTADFVEKMRALHKSQLGRYKGPGETVSEEADEAKGTIVIRLHFEKRDAQMHMVFVVEEGVWKVLRFRLDIPREGAPKKAFADPAIFSTKLMRIWCEGTWEMVWEQFDDDLRLRHDPNTFKAAAKAWIDGAAGDFDKVKLTKLEDDGGDEARTEVDLVFAERTYKTRLELKWLAGRWFVTSFTLDDFESK